MTKAPAENPVWLMEFDTTFWPAFRNTYRYATTAAGPTWLCALEIEGAVTADEKMDLLMAVVSTAQKGLHFCYESGPWTSSTNINIGNLWNVVLAFSLNTCALAWSGTWSLWCFHHKSCSLWDRFMWEEFWDERPPLDELYHYPENSVRPKGELRVSNCVGHAPSSSFFSPTLCWAH